MVKLGFKPWPVCALLTTLSSMWTFRDWVSETLSPSVTLGLHCFTCSNMGVIIITSVAVRLQRCRGKAWGVPRAADNGAPQERSN